MAKNYGIKSRGRSPKIGPFGQDGIRYMHEAGIPVKEIASEWNLSQKTVRHIINRTGAYATLKL